MSSSLCCRQGQPHAGVDPGSLAYSNAETDRKVIRKVPFEDALKDALKSLRATIEEYVTRDPLPAVTADET